MHVSLKFDSHYMIVRLDTDTADDMECLKEIEKNYILDNNVSLTVSKDDIVITV